LLADRVVTVTDQGVLSEDGVSVYLRRWVGIHGVAASDQFVLLCQDDATLVIVPVRAFRDGQHQEEFVGRCRHYLALRGLKPTTGEKPEGRVAEQGSATVGPHNTTGRP
jgi:hypothetical protein